MLLLSRDPFCVVLGLQLHGLHRFSVQEPGTGNDPPQFRHSARCAHALVPHRVAVGAERHQVCDWIQLISARSQVVYKREQELSGWHNMEEEAWKAGDTEHRGRPGNH